MAKAPNGINGPVSGKIGNAVFYSVGEDHFARSLPQKRSGKKTKKEKSNTGGFAKVQSFMKPIKVFLRVGFKNYGSKTGGYKAAVSYALKNAVEGEYQDRYVNPEKIRVSGGELHFPITASATLKNDNILQFNWSTEIGENGNSYDQVFMLAYAPPENETLSGRKEGQAIGAFRYSGTDELQLFSDNEVVEYHVYMGFVSKDRTSQAHSMYMGKVVVPAK
ncbi:MAG: hypothetical protein EOO92_11010 [Pedobacter sp.]|nr:MAG: hypothetical protein EOO92_11010 [Pedobacter sp.]